MFRAFKCRGGFDRDSYNAMLGASSEVCSLFVVGRSAVGWAFCFLRCFKPYLAVLAHVVRTACLFFAKVIERLRTRRVVGLRLVGAFVTVTRFASVFGQRVLLW